VSGSQWSGVAAMRQSAAGKDLNTEAAESTALGAVTKQRLVNTADTKVLLRGVVNCKVGDQ
jgi:hypothetical protein